MEEALSFDGFTGPYFQYTSARLKSILRKAGRKKIALPANAELCLAERRLVADLASYPEVLEVAAKSYRPAKLVSFLFETAKHFAEFYEAVPVLKAPGSERARRIALVAALSEVFSGAFEILGIPQISEM
jgi:arginyl-tRNA synthetase